MAGQRSTSSLDMRTFDTVEPRVEEVSEAGLLTARIHLPGFKKEQLKVQLSSQGILKVSGERPPQPGASSNRWTRFRKEFPLTQDFNLDEIRAKFADGVLQLTIPKRLQASPDQQRREPSPEQDARQQPKPSSPSKAATETRQPVSQPPAAEEATEEKGNNGAGKEKEPAPEPVPAQANSVDGEYSSAAPAVGLRRRRSFVPTFRYGDRVTVKTRGPGFRTAVVALLLLLAGLWFTYVNYWVHKDGTAGTSLAPYSHHHHFEEGF